MGTALAVGTWMVITVSYRTEKRSIVAELIKRLKPTDITDTQRSAAAHDDPTEEMRNAAKEIAQWCLWRWDGICGFRAGFDRQVIQATMHALQPS